MKNLALFLSAATILSATSLYAVEGFCTTCNKVNRYNDEHPQKYKYYEDYLEAVNRGEESPQDPKEKLHEIRKQN